MVNISCSSPVVSNGAVQAPFLADKPILWKKVQSIAAASLKELAVAMAFTAVTCLFVATSAEVSLLVITALAIVALNTLIRAVGTFCYTYSSELDDNSFSHKFCQGAGSVCDYLAPFSFSILDSTTRDVVIHEAGHAIAAVALYEKANPTIQVMPFKGGVTRYWGDNLTKIGKFFGKRDSGLIVAAAGPAAAVLTSTAQIGVAHVIRKTHPTLSRYLKVTAIVSLFEHVRYAFSALSIHHYMPYHDFVALKMGGIHPVTSIVGMVALPLIVKFGLYVYDYVAKID